MRLLLAGDTHANMTHIDYLISVAAEREITRIVQLGDFGLGFCNGFWMRAADAAAAAGVEIWWLDGNHENHDLLSELVDVNGHVPQPMRRGLVYLPRASRWSIDGCEFMALGGAYSIDKAYRTEGVSWWPQELLTRKQVERAMDRGPVDVLLTHDAPEGVCPIIDGSYKGDEISRGNRLAVTAVVEAVRPKLLVHGHYHHRYSNRFRGTDIEGLDRDDMGPASWMVLDTNDERWSA